MFWLWRRCHYILPIALPHLNRLERRDYALGGERQIQVSQELQKSVGSQNDPVSNGERWLSAWLGRLPKSRQIQGWLITALEKSARISDSAGR